MITGFQLIGVAFALLMAYTSFLHFRRREFSRTQFVAWEMLWLIFFLATLFPASLQTVIEQLGFVRALDLLTVGGFLIVLWLSFRTHVRLGRLERKIEEIVRDAALRDL